MFAEYFVAVFIFSTFLTVSIGMCWLFLANSQLTKFNVYVKEDGSAHWQIFNVFYRFCNAIRVKGKHEMFQITTGTTAATTLAVCCNAEIETLNWISFDTNIKIISNSYIFFCDAIPIFYYGFYFLCSLIAKYNVFLSHLFGSKKDRRTAKKLIEPLTKRVFFLFYHKHACAFLI